MKWRVSTSVYSKGSSPNVFIGGLVPGSPGFPIEAFGNDGLLEAGNSIIRAADKVDGLTYPVESRIVEFATFYSGSTCAITYRRRRSHQ